MSVSTPRRFLWVALPLAVMAWMAAPEWPARAGMMDAPWRDAWVPIATAWAQTHPSAASPEEGAPAPTSVTVPASRPAVLAGLDPVANPVAVASSAAPALAHPAGPATASVASSANQASIQVAQQAVQHDPMAGGTVLMIGDSLMGEVAAGMRQNLPRRYAVVDRHKVSTGLTNVAYYDWPGTAQAAASETHPQWVVIHMGANDAQDMLVDKHWIHFGSDVWKATYLARAQALLDRLATAAPGVTVVWVGLPAMRSEEFDAKMAVIRDLQGQAAVSRGVVYLDGHVALGPAYAKDAELTKGHRTILRADDGIHYSRTGGTQLAHEAAVAPVLAFPWGG